MKHVHADVIHAWADGIAIQRSGFMTGHEWRDLEDGDYPDFRGSEEWRVKPEPPAKVYPVTGMSGAECAGAYIDGGVFAIANAALRHAIDAGQLVAPGSARDLAIAEAVRDACIGARFTIPGEDGIDLAAIIATVKE